MITRITKFQIKPELSLEFKAFMRQFKDELMSTEGCRHFDVLKDKEDDQQLLMFMIWKDNTFLEDFRKSDLNKIMVSKLKNFSIKEPSNWTVENVFDPEDLKQQKSLFD